MTPGFDPHCALANLAITYNGVRESGINKGAIIEEFQKAVDGVAQGEPYCAGAVCFWVKRVDKNHGSKNTLRWSESVVELWEKNPHAQRKHPAPGLIACFRYGDTRKGHCGVAFAVNPHADDFNCVEANTTGGPGMEREGDGVFLKKRSVKGTGIFHFLGCLDPWAPHS